MASKPIKLTTTSYALLALLDQLGEGTSYDIKQALDKSIENFWPVPHTTAYEEPARLVEGGYLTAQQEAGGRRRKVYSLTDAGREALRAWANEPVAAPPQYRDEFMLKVFAGAEPAGFAEARLAWHRGKLEELGGYLENVRAAGGEWVRSERVLLAGLAYHRRMIEMIEELRE
jgi:PadR family transcriptional regulator, regulatory protein AphA